MPVKTQTTPHWNSAGLTGPTLNLRPSSNTLCACVCSLAGKWRWFLHPRRQQDQLWHLTQRSHAWGASRPWNWRWGRCGGTSSGPWTTSSCSRTSSGCSAWAWRWPTSAGTSTSRAKRRERAPTSSGRSSGAKTCRCFTAAAWSGRCRCNGAKGGRRLHQAKAPRGPAARRDLGMSTWRWPPGGATG